MSVVKVLYKNVKWHPQELAVLPKLVSFRLFGALDMTRPAVLTALLVKVQCLRESIDMVVEG